MTKIIKKQTNIVTKARCIGCKGLYSIRNIERHQRKCPSVAKKNRKRIMDDDDIEIKA